MLKRACQAAGEIPLAGVSEVLAPHPLEISGVAAVPGGYAVVGDEDNEHGRIWPGGVRFDFAGKLKGPESIDVGMGAGGESLWLVLGERKGRLIDLDGGSCEFADPLRMRHGRGLEGVAVRWQDGRWQVAIAWEGGFYDWDSPARGACAKPRIALLTWTRGEGMRGGPDTTFELEVPEPSVGQRFRAPDLVFDRDGLLVLLASTDARRKRRKHTWLQRFDLAGRPTGEPLRLEEAWGRYHDDKNWEGLDWTLDGTSLVLAHDEKDSERHRALAITPYL
jgi:hypothetical protein